MAVVRAGPVYRTARRGRGPASTLAMAATRSDLPRGGNQLSGSRRHSEIHHQQPEVQAVDCALRSLTVCAGLTIELTLPNDVHFIFGILVARTGHVSHI